jgi:hypothetical protein
MAAAHESDQQHLAFAYRALHDGTPLAHGIVGDHKAHNPEADGVVWRLPAYNTVRNVLANPIYAGAYAFGRTTSKVSVENGRKRVRRGVHRPLGECDVLIKDHHEGYISWDEFERNQRVTGSSMPSSLSQI